MIFDKILYTALYKLIGQKFIINIEFFILRNLIELPRITIIYVFKISYKLPIKSITIFEFFYIYI